MKKCPECGNLSYDGAPVCGNCGAKFSKRSSSSKKGSFFKDSSKPTNEVPKKPKAPQKIIEITEFKPGAPKTADKPASPPEIKFKDGTEIKPEPKKETVKKIKINEKKESVKKESKKNKNEKSTLEIIKEEKLIIGIILLVTIIVIAGIVLTSSTFTDSVNNTTTAVSGDMVDYSIDGFSFKCPSSWKKLSETDSSKDSSIFFQIDERTKIEIYTISNDAKSLKEINNERIQVALSNNDFVEYVESITLDEKNASNIILENSDGDYTRYVSLFHNGKLYVFKITGESFNSVTSEDIDKVIKTAHIG